MDNDLNSMKEFRLIKVSGAARDRGEQYGAEAREEIVSAIEAYKKHFSNTRGLSWDAAKGMVRENESLIRDTLPEQYEELQGAALGAGADFDDIMVLNHRYEFLHFPAQSECTAFAVLRGATADKHMYVGQNWDQRPFSMKHSLILHSTDEKGFRTIGLTEAGQLIRNGLSSGGTAICANSLRSSLDKRGSGIPVSILRKHLLGLGSAEKMRDAVLAAKRSVSANYLVGSIDSGGYAADIEAVPGREKVFEPQNGILTHANHLLGDPSIDISRDKRFRGERLYSLLNLRNGEITLQYIMDCLKDHEGLPEAICSHISDENDSVHKLWQTNASIIYDLDSLRMWICAGPPCEGEYKEYAL